MMYTAEWRQRSISRKLVVSLLQCTAVRRAGILVSASPFQEVQAPRHCCWSSQSSHDSLDDMLCQLAAALAAAPGS